MRNTLIAMVLLGALVLGACSIDIEPNADGSFNVTSELSEQRLQQAIDYSIEDPDVERLEITFHDGYLAVDASGPDEDTGRINDVTFEARLFVTEGHLGVDVYDATWNGEPMPDWIVEAWNDTLARALEREGRKHPDSTLLRVEVEDDVITMEWRVETEQSRS